MKKVWGPILFFLLLGFLELDIVQKSTEKLMPINGADIFCRIVGQGEPIVIMIFLAWHLFFYLK